MSLVRRYYIRCNDCGRLQGYGAESSKDARSAAKRNGWKRAKGSQTTGQDFCPSCGRERAL